MDPLSDPFLDPFAEGADPFAGKQYEKTFNPFSVDDLEEWEKDENRDKPSVVVWTSGKVIHVEGWARERVNRRKHKERDET